RFRLLTEGNRSAPRRHQTLRAAIEWSYELLSAPESLLFQRLSVFAGSFTLEAAEAVCGEDERRTTNDEREVALPVVRPSSLVVAQDEVLDLLGRLVDKSLVLVEADGALSSVSFSGVRYRLLETLREYGQERLVASGETAALRRRHA